MSSKILAFKIVGGEEVVAEVVEEVGPHVLTESGSVQNVAEYVVRRPHVLRMLPNGPGSMGLAFVPWTLSNPEIERLTIPASAVLLAFEPAAHVESQYIQQTSPIALAKQVPQGRISV